MHTLPFSEAGLGHQFGQASALLISYASDDYLPGTSSASERDSLDSSSLEFFAAEVVSSTPKREGRPPKPALRIRTSLSQERLATIVGSAQPRLSPAPEAQKLSPTPSYRDKLAQREKARRRHGIHFESEAHIHVSDALRAVIDCHRKAIAQDYHRSSSPDGDDDTQEGYYWEADTTEDARLGAADCPIPPSWPSSVSELAAAFPFPPTHTPPSARSFIGTSHADLASLSIAPASPENSSLMLDQASCNSSGFGRSPLDPSESFARLEMSMSHLQAFNPFHDARDMQEDESSDSDSLIESEDCVSPASTEASSWTGSPSKAARASLAALGLSVPRPDPFRFDTSSSATCTAAAAAQRERDAPTSPQSKVISTSAERRRESSPNYDILPVLDLRQRVPPSPLSRIPPPRSSSYAAFRTSASQTPSPRPRLLLKKDVTSPPSAIPSTPFLLRPVRQSFSPISSSRTGSSISPSHSAPSVSRPSRPFLPTSLNLKSATPPPSEMPESRSFMNMTPEQPSSRVSKLWDKACSGMGLTKQKSMRWTKSTYA